MKLFDLLFQRKSSEEKQLELSLLKKENFYFKKVILKTKINTTSDGEVMEATMCAKNRG